jgi:hypothetical protein
LDLGKSMEKIEYRVGLMDSKIQTLISDVILTMKKSSEVGIRHGECGILKLD